MKIDLSPLDFLNKKFRKYKPVNVAVVLGSGFSQAVSFATPIVEISYRKIPGFPRPTVPGHRGVALLMQHNGVNFLVFCGRIHFYEGYSFDKVAYPVRLAAGLGVKTVVLTNAVGSLKKALKPGELVVVRDHINLMGSNPLRGLHHPDRFLDVSNLYDFELVEMAEEAFISAGLPFKTGVLAAMCGPSYETAAEIAMLAKLGADVVGMSVVPEALVARFLGLRVLAISGITNYGTGTARKPLSHEEVVELGDVLSQKLGQVLKFLIPKLAKDVSA